MKPLLTKITIPNSVISIGQGAFESCINLTGVYFQGNPPSVGPFVFAGDNKTTIYRLPGSIGWGLTFGGRPIALWRPVIQTSDASFGLRTNRFGFNIVWASGRIVVVEAATNLANPVWTPLQTNTLTSDTLYFSDPHWINHPFRSYRIRSP